MIAVRIETKEIINAKEAKVTLKALIIEPYAFGVDKEGRPILRGNIVKERLIREISVKYGKNHFSKEKKENKSDNEHRGFFKGIFKSEKYKDLDISKIKSVRLLDGTHFDAPKDFKALDEDEVHVVCQLRVETK